MSAHALREIARRKFREVVAQEWQNLAYRSTDTLDVIRLRQGTCHGLETAIRLLDEAYQEIE